VTCGYVGQWTVRSMSMHSLCCGHMSGWQPHRQLSTLIITINLFTHSDNEKLFPTFYLECYSLALPLPTCSLPGA